MSLAEPGNYAYGVPYTPASVKASFANTRSLETPSLDNAYLLDRLGIRYIRIQWLDPTNVTRFRIVPREYMTKILNSSRSAITLVKAALGMFNLTLAPGFPATAELLYVIDPSSFRICTYAPGHASVMGFFQEKLPTPSFGLAVPMCPRTLLKRIVEDAEKEAGIEFLVGVETEFILLKDRSLETGKLVAMNDANWSTSAKFPTGAPETILLEEIADTLIGARIELQMLHAEAAPGQYEVITGPLGPLEAADALVFTRETIRNIAAKHGHRATFVPRLHQDNFGNGAHVHISVHPKIQLDASQRTDTHLAPNLTLVERSFLQGILSHLPAICALSLPTPASYSRVHDGLCSGGTYVVWGSANREAPVRLCGSPVSPSGDGGGHHFEIRCVDATACMYIALAGLLGAGALAVKENRNLALGDLTKPVPEMSQGERAEYFGGAQEGRRLPRSIEEARELLISDDAMKGKVLGPVFVEQYISVNKTLQAGLTGKNTDEEMKALLRIY